MASRTGRERLADDGSRVLSLAALGVVYGDIGTSPLYAMRECFHGEYGIAATQAHVFGVLSLMFWSLVLVVTVKYLDLHPAGRQPGRGRRHRADGPGHAARAAPGRTPAHADPAGPLRRLAALRRRHDHPGHLGAERRRGARRRDARARSLRRADHDRHPDRALPLPAPRHRARGRGVRSRHPGLVRACSPCSACAASCASPHVLAARRTPRTPSRFFARGGRTRLPGPRRRVPGRHRARRRSTRTWGTSADARSAWPGSSSCCPPCC